MNDPTFNQKCEMSSLDHFTLQHIESAPGKDFQHSFSLESYTSYSDLNPPKSTATNAPFSCSAVEASLMRSIGRPMKLLQTRKRNSCSATKVSAAVVLDASSPSFLSFSNQDSERLAQQSFGDLVGGAAKLKDETEFSISQRSKRKCEISSAQESKRGSMEPRLPSHAQDHIIAERKRREKLSQRFIALLAIVPDLKKIDKASILGDTIKYVKQLQERVKTLEDQTMKRTVESVVLVKKSQLSAEDRSSLSDEHFDDHPTGDTLPEIEVKLSGKTILVRIHCENRKGVLVMALAEIEKLHLTIVNTSVMPFAGSALDITVVAQMEEEFSMTVKDLVKSLSSAFSGQFM